MIVTFTAIAGRQIGGFGHCRVEVYGQRAGVKVR